MSKHPNSNSSSDDTTWVIDGPEVIAQKAKAHQGEEMSLADALNLWVEISGVEPGKNKYTMGDWGVLRLHEEIKQALDLDPSELTGTMLLSFIAQSYFEDRTFTVDALLNEPGKVADYLAKVSRLANYLRSPAVDEPSQAFADRLMQSLESYGAATKEVTELVTSRGDHGDRGMLAVLRRDAMLSMAHLQVNQFLDGEPEDEGGRPAYGKFLYRWENINSMLRAMVNAPSGITVNMIQTASNPYGVHFVFAIRNGGKMFTFTDKEWTPHPLAESMWHRPDKILAARANRNWFPYDLAGLKFNEEGRAYIDLPSGKSLVEYQGKGIPMKNLSELGAPQVVWIAMMLDLIVEKFWHQAHREKALSYTGEMLRIADPLLIEARKADLPLALRSQTVLEVEPITLADVHSDRVKEEDVGEKGDGRYRWMEERYGHRVMPETIDMVAAPERAMMIDYSGSADASPALVLQHNPEARHNQLGHFEKKDALAKMVKLSALDATSFGTQEQLEKDRIFLARSNYARQIERFAEQEYEERKEEVAQWVQDHMAANLEVIKPLLGMTSVLVSTEHDGGFGQKQAYGVRYHPEKRQREFIRRMELDADNRAYLYSSMGRSPVILGGLPAVKTLRTCHFTGAVSSYVIQVVPETTEQLAYLCGVSKEGLPDVLQHWTMFRRYVTNPILNRVDPLLGLIESPWDDMHFVLNVFVSKKALKDLIKASEAKPWVEPEQWKKASASGADRRTGKSHLNINHNG